MNCSSTLLHAKHSGQCVLQLARAAAAAGDGAASRSSSRACGGHQFVLALLCALMLLSPVHSELLLAYSIQRHGARNVLPKSAMLTESDATGGPALLPAGQRMCYAAGLAFNARFISHATCAASRPATTTCLSEPAHEGYGVINKPGVGFHNYNTLVASSGLDRTISSANSFLAGVFPRPHSNSSAVGLQAVPPVYTTSECEDWRIRGYSKCPAYQKRLTAWLRSDAFKQQEAHTAALRQKVQGLVPQLNTSLAEWWNVYDAFNSWRTYGVGSPMPPMDNATFAEVVQLAMWLETSKMDPELTGNLLGGGLLGDMLQSIEAAEQAVQEGHTAPSGEQAPSYYKLKATSSHYNTQLGVLSTLQAGVPPAQRTQHPWTTKIPSLAAVLVFELHRGPAADQALWVRAVFQDGPQTQYQVLPLPCAVAGDAAEAAGGPGSCSLEAFRALAGPQALNSSGDWCGACGNTQVEACVVRGMERQLTAPGRSKLSAAMVALISAVAVLGVLAVVGLGGLGLQKLRQQKAASFHRAAGQMHGVQQSPVDLSRPAPV